MPAAMEIKGVGVVQPESGLDFPFVNPSDDIKYLIADFYVSVDDPGNYGTRPKFQPPFLLKCLYGIGTAENTPPHNAYPPVHAVDIVVCDSNNVAVFDTTRNSAVLTVTPWGDDYVLYKWVRGGGQDGLNVCSMLLYASTAVVDGQPRPAYEKYLTPQNAVLDARAVYIMPKRLLSIRVGEGGTRIKGKINFQNGYNTEIATGDATATDFVTNTAVVFSAAAGGGLGKYPSCFDDSAPEHAVTAVPITKINGVSAATGDFLLAAADCLYARRPTVKQGENVFPAPVVLDGHMSLGADCAPCCQCQDYVDLANKINQYGSQYANIGLRVDDVKNIHEQNISKWLTQRDCGIHRPLRLLLVAQRCPYLDVVAMVCNPCTDCLYSKNLRLELEPAIGTEAHGEIVKGYTALFTADVNGRPISIERTTSGRKTVFTIPFRTIKASDSGYVRFRVKFSTKKEYAVTGLLTGTLTDDTPILTGCSSDETTRVVATATATQALYCDAAGNTTSP